MPEKQDPKPEKKRQSAVNRSIVSASTLQELISSKNRIPAQRILNSKFMESQIMSK